MADATLTQILLSGGLGALFTGVISHIVRRVESRQDKQERESKNAYVYLTKLGRILAAGHFAQTYANSFRPLIDKPLEEAKKKSGNENIDATHFIVSVTYAALKEALDRNDANTEDLKSQMLMVSGFADKYLDFFIPHDVQASLPKEAILHYAIFIDAASYLKDSIYLLLKWLEGANIEYSAANLYSLWLYAKEVYETAECLQKTLKIYGRISNSEIEKIQIHHRGAMARGHLQREDAKTKVDALATFFRNELSKAATDTSAAREEKI